jgi:predicted ArsR family transcriptional regulator
LRARIGSITAVTVRYHLDILRGQGLIETARVRRRNSPGRPQYIYTLTEQAQVYFPKNYKALAEHILDEIKRNLSPAQVSAIINNVAERMAEEAAPDGSDLGPQARMKRVVAYLSEKGYQASWEMDKENDQYLLHISNCPYHPVAKQHGELCSMDMQMITAMIGTQPGCTCTIAEGEETCTYKAQLTG